MAAAFRKLNDDGVEEFVDYLRSGGAGQAPRHLLNDPAKSEPLSSDIFPKAASFQNRHEFGRYLVELLSTLDPQAISRDKGLWTGLALFWFDEICPPKANGERKLDKEYRYVLSRDYRHYYRHSIRSPWQLVRDHGDHARFLLVTPKPASHPLAVHGEILEQIGGRQQVLASTPIISIANDLYLDKSTGRPKKGVAGRGAGSANRFGTVLRQFELTYDPASMVDGALIDILPGEFGRWKNAP
ncbi:hypothetical protein NGM99_17165 [Mesorhizobium sp. RP14(2022)]|uniref:Uncharacterized protein n=1 Tax=Mesorhizobium liriopis TaxID=2953882 RepID=A0ABT1C9R0_9HYPH|nr:hypothetical protein [Mesorhizobium liriopis]MCO6051517.1 hypothetical protein [Mesorhizobium liriopis]